MKTTIVCGMLGSGKTTFIQNYVKNAGEKIVVLVNDFGQTGIDGEIFTAGGIESVELPSGCICCTLKFDLMTTLQKIMENLAPEHLIIEPSGVASPSCVLESLDAMKISPATVVGLVDATEFLEFHASGMYGSFFEDQLMNSDVVLVNKIDLAGEETAEKTAELVEKINPRAILFRTVNATLNEPLPEGSSTEKPAQNFEPHFHFETFTFRWKQPPALESLRAFFEGLASGKYGKIVRAKALALTDRGSFRFDLSHSHSNSVPFGRTVSESRLVIIGKDLEKEMLDHALRTQT